MSSLPYNKPINPRNSFTKLEIWPKPEKEVAVLLIWFNNFNIFNKAYIMYYIVEYIIL